MESVSGCSCMYVCTYVCVYVHKCMQVFTVNRHGVIDNSKDQVIVIALGNLKTEVIQIVIDSQVIVIYNLNVEVIVM